MGSTIKKLENERQAYIKARLSYKRLDSLDRLPAVVAAYSDPVGRLSELLGGVQSSEETVDA